MKVWKFYLIPEKDNQNKRYDLYAITNNKKYAKRFKEERNMDMFIERCTDEDKSDYIKFINDNRHCALIIKELMTRDVYKNGYIGTKKVEVLLTIYEHENCDTENIVIDTMEDGMWNSAIPYRVYKKKLLNSLRLLDYVSNYKLYSLDFNNMVIDPEDDDYSAPDIYIDELGLFIRYFGRTFK